MKKLYRRGTVHPSSPPVSDCLAFLPPAFLTLAAALSPEDREVLAYLLSCSCASASTTFSGHNSKTAAKSGCGGDHHHPALFSCSCFGCYTSYWARWDASPSRQLIHEIIDSFEDWLMKKSKNQKSSGSRKGRRKRGFVAEAESLPDSRSGRGESESAEEASVTTGGGGDGGVDKGSLGKLVSLIGESIWNVWSK